MDIRADLTPASATARSRRPAAWAAAMGLAIPAMALPGASAQAQDVQIVKTADLRFGDFVPLGAAVVVVPPNGFARYVEAVAVSGSQARAARFELTGKAGTWVEVQTPAAPVRIRFAGGEALVRDFVVEATGDAGLVSLGGGRYRLRLDPGGASTLDLGAALHLASAGGEGSGTANFTITIIDVD